MMRVRLRGRRLALTVALAILFGLVAGIGQPGPVSAALGAGDFLKASGTVLRNNSGAGSVVSLRGTNLGGWLTLEQWMSPLGEGALSRSGWTATGSGSSGYANAFDGNAATRWTDGAAQTANGNWFQIDMGGQRTFDHISIDAAAFTGDSPAGLTIQVSANGSSWTTVSVIKDKGNAQLKYLTLDQVYTARYILLIQTGTSSSWWSIAELNVYQADDYSMRTALYNRFGVSAADTLLDGYQNTWITTADLDNIQNMGMNVIRVPISWQELVNADGSWKPGAFTQLDWVVSQASARNIYVMLDLHVVPGGGCPWASCGQAGPNPNGFWTNTANQDLTVAIWEGLANHFKGNPAVAGYDLINEPLLSYSETTTEVATKSAVYDRLYDAVRAIDPDHTIFIGAFFGFDKIAAPSTYGWTNVVYEIHPYDMPNAKDWNAQNTLVTNSLNTLAQYQQQWNVPVFAGEYSLYFFYDVWEKWMSGLNALNASWTNWTYKVTGTVSESGGANWGFYNTNTNPVPDVNNDSSATIASKWSQFGTGNFLANTNLMGAVKKHTGSSPWMATVPIDQTGWTATASASGSGTPASNAIDWNSSTRWSTGALQASGQWFQVNMGAKKVFDQISLETDATNTSDYPVGFQVQVSNDGSSWTTIATGAGFGHKMVLPFATQFAQYVRVTQTGSSTAYWWNIAEFHVFNEQPVSRTGWSATATSTESGGSAANALDGNLSTRWSSGVAQANGQSYQVDMGSSRTFNRLSLDLGTSTSDYPRGYQIQVSNDASSWTTVATGSGTSSGLVVDFPVQVARYLKIVQTGTSTSWWSIAELNIYGELERSRTGWSATASSTETGGSAANALDGNASTRWSGGAAQASGQWYRVDLGSSQWFNHLVLDSGTASPTDYPRSFLVQASSDGTNWTTIANAFGTGQVTTVNFPIAQARYLRLQLTGSSGSWWSISELRLYD